MVAKKRALLVGCFFVLFCVHASAQSATAQATPPSSELSAEDDDSVGYQYILDKDGNPFYSQEISWESDPYALEYEVTVVDSAGEVIVKNRQEGNVLSLNLSPGDYAYNIVTINLLEQLESETGFLSLQILRAELPEISSISPGFIFMDSFNSLVTIQGKLLQEGSRIVLRKRGEAKETNMVGTEQSRQGDSEVVVEFPSTAYVPGTFDITIVNPGGLFAIKKDALRIMYQRPLDILFSAGYSPVFLLHDAWFKDTWKDPMYWAGADSSLSVYFVKKAWGFVGLGLDVSAHRLTGGIDMAQVTSDYLLSGVNLLYKFRINRVVHLLARGGAGVDVSHHSFDFDGNPGPDDTFSGLCAHGGLAVQCFLPHRIYIEAGADWVEMFAGEHNAGLIRPVVRVGYQLF